MTHWERNCQFQFINELSFVRPYQFVSNCSAMFATPFSFMSRRTFISLPALFPMIALTRSKEHEYHFHLDHILGTSLDLTVVAGDEHTADRVLAAVLGEVQRLTSVLNTRDPLSEISMLDSQHFPSDDLSAVLSSYAYWERKSEGVITIYP